MFIQIWSRNPHKALWHGRSLSSTRRSQGVVSPINVLQKVRLALIVLILASVGIPASAATIRIAVASNFTDAAKDIASTFKQKTGHDVLLSFGASGTFYTQITQDAPFQIFLSADELRPKTLIADGFANAGSDFTYAVGKLVLWSTNPDLIKGPQTLTESVFEKLAICNPAAAPYGAASVETLKALHVYESLSPKIVQGANITQAFQFVSTGNAELGFVALSQIADSQVGSKWIVPQNLYSPIRQVAVVLQKGVGNDAVRDFMLFLKGPQARAIMEKYGYFTE